MLHKQHPHQGTQEGGGGRGGRERVRESEREDSVREGEGAKGGFEVSQYKKGKRKRMKGRCLHYICRTLTEVRIQDPT